MILLKITGMTLGAVAVILGAGYLIGDPFSTPEAIGCGALFFLRFMFD